MQVDEATTAYVSRLAHLHGKTSRQFCGDLGLGFQSVVDGRSEALDRLSDLSGAPSALLRHNALVRTTHRRHRWRGQALEGDNLSRYTLRVCPRCIEDDLRKADGRGGPGPYGRAIWLIGHVRTCLVHHVALVELPASWKTVHDFTPALSTLLPTLRAGRLPGEERIPSALETYLVDRLEARPRRGGSWLDELGFSVVAETCEVAGAVTAFGRHVKLRSLDANAWHVAGDVGFTIMVGRPGDLRQALAAWDAGLADESSSEITKATTFGPFHTFLSRHQERRPELEPVRLVVMDYLMRTSPVAPGDLVLGRRVEERLVHSVRTAADEHGLDTRLVRKFLRQLGALDERSDSLSNEKALFDARANAADLGRLARSVPQDAVASHIGASAEQTRAILNSGLIPTLLGGTGPFSDYAKRYDPAELARFVARLERDAVEIPPSRRGGSASIVIVARMVESDPMTIVRLVLDRRLPWVGRLAGMRGHDAVRIRAVDVETCLHRPITWSLTTLSNALGLEYATVRKLVDKGILPARPGSPGQRGRPAWSIDDADVSEFKETFAWARSVKRRGSEGQLVRSHLEALGIEPVLDRSTFGRDFYLRRQVLEAHAGRGAKCVGVAPMGAPVPEPSAKPSKAS